MSARHQPPQATPDRPSPTPASASAPARPELEAPAPDGDGRLLDAPGLATHPTARAMRRADALRVQGTHGNRHLSRMLAQRQELDPPADPNAADALGAGEPTGAASGLIVDDSVADPGRGQMRKSDFLAELRTAVAATVDETLAGTPWSDLAGPEIERWLATYRGFGAASLERSLRREVPAAAGAATARDYIPIVCQHVRAELRRQLPAATDPGDLIGAASGALASVAKTVAKAASSAAKAVSSAVGSALSAIGGLFFKRRPDTADAAGDPAATLSRLGTGDAIDGGVRSGMEEALGHDFSRVRVHTDGQAARLADELGARAFTVGEDVAFGAGEYQPGTPVGDALIAHELAHVAQQAGTDDAGPLAKGEDGAGQLEKEADRSAIAAVVSLWGRTTDGLAEIKQHALPRLKTGPACAYSAAIGRPARSDPTGSLRPGPSSARTTDN